MIDTTSVKNIEAISTIRSKLWQFIRKYFLEGQKYTFEESTIVEENHKNIDDLLIRHRKLFGNLLYYN
ncbi:unnamed protein product [Cercopithifilaria johnstoni]|uniref:Uncharacterized protein n=1 Tax=Cercopithifilaria johnstoni TaxID=2874296 RepID=A0A8J2M3Z4_9BILA|nr:unnamed protein product [Cercopithifilaria johnstoni]